MPAPMLSKAPEGQGGRGKDKASIASKCSQTTTETITGKKMKGDVATRLVLLGSP